MRPEGTPRVLALAIPDLPLQRAARERMGRSEEAPSRPLAVAHEGRLTHCDRAAWQAGARPGDSAVQAQAACATLVVVPLDERGDLLALQGLAEALLSLAPAVEVSPPDVLLVDAGAAHLGGGEAALLARAVEAAAQMGFRCRGAVASGRGPARALAAFGPGAGQVVREEETARALARLPVRAMGLSAEVCERLAGLGVADVGALARLPRQALVHRFGAAGERAARLARGDDPSPLSPWEPQALPEESFDFDGPVEALDPILFAMRRLGERVAARLAGRGLGATKLKVTLKLDPRGEERVLVPLARPTAAAARWFPPLRERLTLLRLPAAVVAVALAAVEVGLAPADQLALGDRPEQIAALEAVLARLSARLGEGALFAAAPADRHRPEAAYVPTAFAGDEEPRGAPRAREEAAPYGPAPPPGASTATVRPSRLFPEPRPLVAEGEGGRVTAMRLDGRAYPVLLLVGPERLCGEWWSEPFARDYFRARLDGLGDCWIFRDGQDGRLWLHGLFD